MTAIRSIRTIRRGLACLITATAVMGSPVHAQQEKATRLGPVPRDETTGRVLKVLDEVIAVRCAIRRDVLECTSDTEITAENTAAPVSVTFEVDRLAHELRVNGIAIPLTAPEAEFVQIGEAELASGTSKLFVSIPGAFRLDGSARAGDLFQPILVTRHPLLGEYPGRPLGAELSLQSVRKFERWGSVERTRASLQYPNRWRWMPTDDHPSTPPNCSSEEGSAASNGLSVCTRTVSGGCQEVVWTWSRAADGEPFVKTVALAPREQHLFNGGPFFGAGWGGGAGCLDCKEAIRLRAGYEVGVNSWGLLALAGEFSPSDRLTLVPSFDVEFIPQVGPVPAVTLGAGVPFRVNPSTLVGGRVQASGTWTATSFASVGIVVVLDVFPATVRAPAVAGVIVQAGL